MVRNATKLYYPIRESIASLLPLVDEFVVALGDCDADDRTREEILRLDSDKVRIIDTVWDLEAYPHGMENAHQTDIAKAACKGDWLFYLQADEVVHEEALPLIREKCAKYLDDDRVEGFLFKFLHFWGRFDRYLNAHGWYLREIRIVRNDPDIHSWKSAQSFRRIPDFDGRNYRQEKGTYKLNVVPLDATIHHYGWVRPPRIMSRKKKVLGTIHKGGEGTEGPPAEEAPFDYGNLDRLPRFEGTHPTVMKEWIARADWSNSVGHQTARSRRKYKHERFRNRFLTFLEQRILGGSPLFTRSNWHLIKDE